MTTGSDKYVYHLQVLIHETGKNGVFRDRRQRIRSLDDEYIRESSLAAVAAHAV
jgi:hypothetical protein